MSKEQQEDLMTLGKVIGTYNDFDDIDNCVIEFYDFIPNELGTKFIPMHSSFSVQFSTLVLDYLNGVVELRTGLGTENASSGPLKVDWSVFNT